MTKQRKHVRTSSKGRKFVAGSVNKNPIWGEICNKCKNALGMPRILWKETRLEHYKKHHPRLYKRYI